MVSIKQPFIINNLFSDEDFNILKQTLKECPKNKIDYDNFFGRYRIKHPIIDEYLSHVKNNLQIFGITLFDFHRNDRVIDEMVSKFSLFSIFTPIINQFSLFQLNNF